MVLSVVSEQTFLIVILVTDSVPSGSGFNPAILNEDYELGVSGTSFVQQFSSNQQRIMFSFILFSDTVPEGTDAFLAISAPKESGAVGGVTFDVPRFLPPTKLFSGTYVIVEDDDPIIIGFEETNYTVDESIGMLEVYVSVSNPPIDQKLFAAIDLVIQTISSNATGGADYVELNVNNFDVLLEFNDAARRLMFQVTIIDDTLFESIENFNLELRFDPFVPIPSGVILSPNVSTVYILDDDNVTVGFINPPYSVFENESQLVIQVGVLEGSLEREVVVSFSTSDSTAVGGNDYVRIQNVLLTFGPTNTTVDIPVTINDDIVYELTEIFNAALSFPGDPLPRVTLSPDSAQITIVDFQIFGRCFVSVDCNEEPGDDLGEMSIEDCCLNTPAGLAFNADGSETCTPCIVFGFLNDSFIGVEQGPGHTVQAGWQKGAAQGGVNLVLNVINRDITAREGSSFDYTINTNQVRFLYRRPDPPEDVVFIFRMDAIAQEMNETLTLELERVPGSAALPTGDGVFFRNNITMTIIDNDVVHIFFTEDDFRASEAPENGEGPISFMPVRVIKTSRIAKPIVLDVIPLTVDMARANTPPALPANIPVNNPFSPPFADLNDFNNTVIRITFDPDENLPDNERAASIPIVNDLINEADEQVFIVRLRLIDSINSSAIDLTTRASSICRIINDDPIQIGFELAAYTYVEPPFETTINEFNFVPPTNLTANGPIYIIKEDNVVSEQTFLIVIQVTDSVPSGSGFNPATLNEDYELAFASRFPVLQILANQQRILFSFTLFSDTVPEGTEAFLANSAPEDSALVGGIMFDVPCFLPPTKLFPGTYVIIEDDDPIIIGFEETKYTIDESVRMLEVYVGVLNPLIDQKLFASVYLVIQTISTNAIGGADYVELNVNNFDVLLQFDDNARRLMFQVTIFGDSLLESMENFNIELRFDPFRPIPSGVILIPNVSTVYILDDDNVTIGFINPPYSVFENESQLVIQVGVLEGSLEREVVVSFSTSDLTAVGGNDYVGIPNLLLTFGPTNTIVDIPASINNDNVYELTEIFNAALSFPGDPLPRVTLSPDSTQITIIDED